MTEPERWPAPRVGWSTVGLLLVAYTFSFADRMALTLLVAPIRAALHISDVQVSLLIGLAFSLFYSVMGLPCAFLADRVDRRRLISVGVALWSVATICCAFASDFSELFAARMVVGIGESVLMPTTYSMLADLFPKHRLTRALAIFTMGAPLGGGAALMFGAVVVEKVSRVGALWLPGYGDMAGWRLTFLCLGLPGLGIAAAIRLFLPEPDRRGGVVAGSSNGRDPLALFRFLAAYRRPFGGLFLGCTSMSLVLYGFLAWIPSHMIRSFGATTTEAALPLGTIFAVFGSLGLVAGGAVVDRSLLRGDIEIYCRVLVVSVALACPFAAVAGLAPHESVAVALLAPLFFLGMVHGAVLPAALRAMTPNHLRAQVSAAYYVCQNLLGMALGPTLIAMLATAFRPDPQALGWGLALVSGLILPSACILILASRKPVQLMIVRNT